MLQRAVRPDPEAVGAFEAREKARDIAAGVSTEDLVEIERVLTALDAPRAELHFHPDLQRALVPDFSLRDGQPSLITSIGIVNTLRALGWIREIPGGVPTIKRAQITPAGSESLTEISRGNELIAEIQVEPEIAPAPVKSRKALRADLADMPEEDRLPYCLDLLDQFIGEDRTVFDDWLALGVRFSDAELRLATRLAADRERTVRHAILQYVVSTGRSGEIVSPEAVRKLVHGVRGKLRAAGLPIEIKITKGVGYAICAPGDFNIPGEETAT